MIIRIKGGYFNMPVFRVFDLKGQTSENWAHQRLRKSESTQSEATLIMPVVKPPPPLAMKETKL